MPTYLKLKPKTTDESMTTLIEPPTKTSAATNPELELLLCCARTKITTETAERIKTLVQQNINWNYLIETAGRHAVIPLLYQSLKTTCPEKVPADILAQLKNVFHSNAFRNLFFTQELLKLLALLKEHGIQGIPLKGPVLAAEAYRSLGLRQFGDLDILVSKQDFLKAIDLLINEGGYHQKFPQWFLSDAKETARLTYANEHSLVRNDSKVFVDIHQSITAKHFFSFSFDFEYLWPGVKSIPLIDNTVPNLGLSDLLIILCVHGSKHLWERLGWICDIAELVNMHQEEDWEQIMAQARNLGSERMLLLGLCLAHNLLEATLPESVQQRIQADSQCQKLAAQIRYFFSQSISQTEGFNFQKFSFHIRMMERLQDKVHYCLGSFFRWVIIPVSDAITPTFWDQQFLPLPKPLYFLYYLIRPIRVISEFGKLLLRLPQASHE